MIDFVEKQVAFVLETTAEINDYHEFLLSRSGMILFNSTCMCLQSVGEAIKRIDDTTRGGASNILSGCSVAPDSGDAKHYLT